MDAIEKYRTIVRKVVNDYASYKPSHGQIETEVIIDPEKDHYEVVHVGWDGNRRIHGSVIHLDIIKGKIWIQYDGTSRPVAEALVEEGISHDAIVLGFQPTYVRKHTSFAVN